MIPIKLTIKGMYSYREEQTVDFSGLTKNHLFGIFGPVGSGKSTILEAMSYALYGETERLNKRDGRNYNMMNLKSREIAIDYTFRSGEKNQELFLFTVRGSRDRKDFTNVPKLDRQAYKHDGKDWIPLESADGAKIIGLSYDNFRRTIIIPQGKFQEFLQLGDADRTNMMKEIFNLSRYDLTWRTEQLDRLNASQLSSIQGQLLQVGDVDEAVIREKEALRVELVAVRASKEQAISADEVREKAMQDSKTLLLKVENAARTHSALKKSESSYHEREKLVEEYEHCQKHFPDVMKQRKDVQKELQESEIRLQRDQENLKILEAELDEAEQKFEIIRREYDQRQNLQTRWNELESIAEILKLDKEIGEKTESLAQLNNDIQKQDARVKDLRTLIKAQESEAKAAKAEIPDTKILMEIKQWADKLSSFHENVNENAATLKEQREELEGWEKKRNKVLDNTVIKAHTSVPDRKLPLEQIIKLLQGAVVVCQTAIESKEGEIESLKQTEVLETFSSELVEDVPCPLCGSKSHPQIYASQGVREKIHTLTKGKKDLSKQVSELQNSLQDLGGLRAEIDAAVRAQSKTDAELQTKQRALQSHKKSYKWEKELLDKVDGEINRAESLMKKVETLEGKLEKNRSDVEKQESALTKQRDSFQLQKQVISELSGKRKGLSGALRQFKDQEIHVWTTITIQREIKNLKDSYRQVESSYSSLDKDIRDDKERRGKLQGSINTEKTSNENIAERLRQISDELRQRLEEAGYVDVAQVEKILSGSIDTKRERSEIKSYFQSLISAQDLLDKLEEEAGGAAYDGIAHQNLKDTISTAKRDLGRDNEEIGRLNLLVTGLTEKLKEKEKLITEKEKLELRAMNLLTLKSLFRGSGFVNYASRLYLQNLCGIANQRFTQLTRQKLRLELSEENSFEVRDFLNDGKLRSVKTLSGGQTFQASLSLALGLADSLQQLARTEENFFFLDEGFGSLDKESLQIVFDALKSLRSENRVVGVISHVEEMQQEIDNYIKVELDAEIGSIIVVN